MTEIAGFSVKETIREDPVFQWVRADAINGDPVVVQILHPDAKRKKKQIDALKEYFETLMHRGRPRHLSPTQLLGDPPVHPLVVVYPDEQAEPLRDALAREPKNAERWWRQACDALQQLHVMKLVYGCVSLESFVVIGGKTKLTNFGYAPLLESGHAGALAECGALAAPEVREQSGISPKSDIHGLAKAVAEWKPKVKTSDWYKKATADDPSNRYEKIGELSPRITEEVRPTIHTLKVRSDPKTAGAITGGGDYQKGESVEVEARPGNGWQFEHWSGDLDGHENPATVTMDADQVIVAHFTKIPMILRVSIEPPEAGNVWVDEEYVEGEVEFAKGQEATVAVQPTSDDWKFTGWKKDAAGSENPITVVMDANKAVVAHFEFVGVREPDGGSTAPAPSPIYELDTKADPSRKAGKVTGGGRYQVGADGEPSDAVIEAIARKGYRFDHWEGDLPAGAENPARLTMDGNKTVVAHFVKVKVLVHLEADADPPTAGRVEGRGDYELGSKVTVRAIPASEETELGEWVLGDQIRGPSNPIRIKMDGDKHVTARFRPKDSTQPPAAQQRAIRNKVRIMMLGSPLTVCPFLVCMTGLMAIWALSIVSGLAVFGCIAGMMITFGVFLSRLILGSEKLRNIAIAEIEEETSAERG